MDVIIPAHNLKILSSSISTLSKIGKILYIEFDPLDGLTIRALNDAKSSFVSFHFEVGFFERCSSSSSDLLSNGRNRRNRTTGRNGNGSRRRNGGEGGTTSTSTSPQRYGRRRDRFRRRSRGRSTTNANRSKRSRSHENNNEESDNGESNHNRNETNIDEDNDEKYLCKVPIKTIASILRPRKGVTSLRIRSSTTNPSSNTNRPSQQNDDVDMDHDLDYNEEDEIGSQMQLSFEYNLQHDGIMRILHKVGVSNAEGIIALAPKRHCSEIVTLPKLLLTMLDQVKSTTEVALTVNDVTKKVIASSFHYGQHSTTDNDNENGNDENGGNVNIMLNATNAAILKTETSIDCHEFEEFHFMDCNDAQQILEEEENDITSSTTTTTGGGGGERRHLNRHQGSSSSTLAPPPEKVGEQITLVFSIKEAKAMLQFCASSQASYVEDEDARVIVSFYWGGRPIILETEGEAFRGELILATVDHSNLNGMNASRYTSGNDNGNDNGGRSSSRGQR